MSGKELFFLIFTLLGGLALFIFGMNIMTQGLRSAVGAKLQSLLSKTTQNRFAGLGLGTILGTTIHSSATSVMLVGFVNAGLMTLEQTITPMLGANIGTTLSMQAISFKISDYSFLAIALGLIISLVSPSLKVKDLGRAFLGFGLLFLGMDIMSGSIQPHREFLSYYLQGINGNTLAGVLIGLAVSGILTAVWQSSGATIAIIFAMVDAQIFTEFSQVFPIVLGAHFGTCTTSLLGSIGTNIEARRTALGHLFFNLFNIALAIALRPLFYRFIPMTSGDLIRQTANLHTAIMVVAALFIIPIPYYYAGLIRRIARSDKPMPESSYLDYKLLKYPEQAIVAGLSELKRVAKVCACSLHLNAQVILKTFDRKTVLKIKTNEKIINEIKSAMREYLWSLSTEYLSRRQIIMVNELNKCMSDIERVGDHIEELCELSLKTHKSPDAVMDKESFECLFKLYEKSINILTLVIESLNPEQEYFQEAAKSILNARDEYIQLSMEAKEKFMKKVETHEITPLAAMCFNEYIVVLDRMIRHIKSIALAQNHEDFWIKKSKFNKRRQELNKSNSRYDLYDLDPNDYLSKLKIEQYL